MKEVKAYAFSIDYLLIKQINALKEMEGFYGVKPDFPIGTLLIFNTENNAKRAMNELESYGIKTGNNICECFIPEEYAREMKNNE